MDPICRFNYLSKDIFYTHLLEIKLSQNNKIKYTPAKFDFFALNWVRKIQLKYIDFSEKRIIAIFADDTRPDD